MELSRNTILITGGASGFGLEFATRLIALGNTVIITGRDKAKLAQAKQLLPQVHTYSSDVSDPGAIKALYDQVTAAFPALNVLINNAGEMRKINLHDTTISLTDISREIEINLMGPVRMVQQFLPHLKAQPQAAILNVTSGLAMVPFPISPVYGASKAGLRSYTQSLRVQLQHTRVKVFELAAPAASTTLGDKFEGLEGYSSKSLMTPANVVAAAIKAMQHDKEEIYPGMAMMLRIMSRLAPKFILGQLGKVGASLMK